MPAYAIYRAANNHMVNRQIKSRQLQLPVQLQAGETMGMHLFFPVTPSPRQIEVTYVDFVERIN